MNIEIYYIIELEISLKNSPYVFGFVNISHIPYLKFEEVFKDQVTDERFLFDDSKGYDIDVYLYTKHQSFFDSEIPFNFDFDLFEYSVRLSTVDAKDYKRNYYINPPPNLTLK
jgi:hypothetical protein